jgi:hypothetical protein
LMHDSATLDSVLMKMMSILPALLDKENMHLVFLWGSIQYRIYPHSRSTFLTHILFSPLLTLHISLTFVKCNIPLDLFHAFQWFWVVPRRVFYFRLIGCDGVVACVAFVRTVSCGVCRCEVVGFDGIRWELETLEVQKGNKRRGCRYVDVSVDDFV